MHDKEDIFIKRLTWNPTPTEMKQYKKREIELATREFIRSGSLETSLFSADTIRRVYSDLALNVKCDKPVSDKAKAAAFNRW